jgi:hypothetical protein
VASSPLESLRARLERHGSCHTLAEAATFIIRKTVIAILQFGFREKFKDRDARDDFWLYEYGLDNKQSKKRLRDMRDRLGLP